MTMLDFFDANMADFDNDMKARARFDASGRCTCSIRK